MDAKYDRIGLDYARLRRADPRIAAQIETALGGARSVLNVGAGAGSYEPATRAVTALDPSVAMIAQRPEGAGPAVQGVAEDLPFADQSFDAVMAVLTVHHWTDKAKAMAEMQRVSRGRIVILTFDARHPAPWPVEYFPGLAALDEEIMPDMAQYTAWLGPVRTEPVPVPRDCTDGFLCAYWRRPAAYLDARVRAAISSFHALTGQETREGCSRLAADLESGRWQSRNRDLLQRETLDCGYRLLIRDP